MTRSKIINPHIELEDIAPGGRIGLIALATDYNSEQDLRRMLPEDVEIFTNRVLNANPLTLENLRKMLDDISRAAGGILPEVDMDAMIYGCTSGTVANGADKIEFAVQQGQPGVPVTNPMTAVLAAFEALNARRVSILTPYIDELNQEMLAYFRGQGKRQGKGQDIDVINIVGLGFESDIDVTRIPAQDIYRLALEVFDREADALFLSCTALRASSLISKIEDAIGKPVVTSNQALVWHCLKLINYSEKVSGFGCLLEAH